MLALRVALIFLSLATSRANREIDCSSWSPCKEQQRVDPIVLDRPHENAHRLGADHYPQQRDAMILPSRFVFKLAVLSIVTGAIFLSLSPQPRASTVMYSMHDLGSLGCCVFDQVWESDALGINSSGAVVGRTTSPDGTRIIPFIHEDGTMAALSADWGDATSINDAGQVTGTVHPAGTAGMAFLSGGGVLTLLGALPGYSNMPYSVGHAINSAGAIVGESNAKAMIYANGEMSGFKTHNTRIAYGVNDAGDVVGMMSTVRLTPQGTRAFLKSGNTVIDLGTLDEESNFSLAYAINERRQIVGYSLKAGHMRAFLYENGIMTDLGTLAGGYSYAVDINRHGHVLGISDLSAFLYRDGAMIDLNQSFEKDASGILPKIQTVTALNDNGEIVGSGYFMTNDGLKWRAFIMRPILQAR